jgi:hypothetical protein
MATNATMVWYHINTMILRRALYVMCDVLVCLAHGTVDIRARQRIETFKTQPCADPARLSCHVCMYGARCNYCHPVSRHQTLVRCDAMRWTLIFRLMACAMILINVPCHVYVVWY